MKKSKILVLGLIALLLAGGLMLAGCGEKCPKKGGCYLTVATDSYDSCKNNCIENQAAKSATVRNLSCDCQ